MAGSPERRQRPQGMPTGLDPSLLSPSSSQPLCAPSEYPARAVSEIWSKQESPSVRNHILGERCDFSCVAFLPLINLHCKPQERCLCCCISWSFLGVVPASREGDGMQCWHWHRALSRVRAPRVQPLCPGSVKVLALPFLSVVWERHEN